MTLKYIKIAYFALVILFVGLFFGLSINTAHAATPISCPLFGDNVIDFSTSQALRADANSREGLIYKTYTRTNIAPGTFKITMVTWDDHGDKGGQGQRNEVVDLELWTPGNGNASSIITTIGRTRDIPENSDSITTVLTNRIVVNQTIGWVGAIHPFINRSNNPESVYPICVKLERLEQPDPIEASCRVSDSTIRVGESVTFTADVSGGDSPFDYSWTGDISGNDRSETVRFNSPGTYRATVTVTDDDGQTDSDDCLVHVEDDPQPNPINVLCRVSDSIIRVGESVTFTADVSGGEFPFTYRWSDDVFGNDRSETVSFSREGTYRALITITDDNGQTDSDDCLVHVEDDDDPDDFEINCRVSDTSIEEGDSVRFSVDIDGGNSPFDYEWDGDIEGEDDDNSTLRVEYDDEGSYRVEVTVTDDDGRTRHDDCPTVRVDDDNDNFSITCRVSDTRVDEGDRVRFWVTTRGGDRPFDYEWDGDIEDEDDDESRLSVRYDDDGRYRVEVEVRDDDGNRDSDDCPTVVVGDDDDDEDINVFSDRDIGNFAGLQSVFLNQVPFTGSNDTSTIISFILSILVLSILIAVHFVKRYRKYLHSMRIDKFRESNRINR